MTVVGDLDGEDGYILVRSQWIRRARKDHRCQLGNHTIPKGSGYRLSVVLDSDRSMFFAKECANCLYGE